MSRNEHRCAILSLGCRLPRTCSFQFVRLVLKSLVGKQISIANNVKTTNSDRSDRRWLFIGCAKRQIICCFVSLTFAFVFSFIGIQQIDLFRKIAQVSVSFIKTGVSAFSYSSNGWIFSGKRTTVVPFNSKVLFSSWFRVLCSFSNIAGLFALDRNNLWIFLCGVKKEPIRIVREKLYLRKMSCGASLCFLIWPHVSCQVMPYILKSRFEKSNSLAILTGV